MVQTASAAQALGRRDAVPRRQSTAAVLSPRRERARLYAIRVSRTVGLTAHGTPIRSVAAPRGTRDEGLAAAPVGRDYAVVRRSPGGASHAFAVHTGPDRFLFGFPGASRGLAWSPDGRWLAVASPARGHAPRLEGWCCRG